MISRATHLVAILSLSAIFCLFFVTMFLVEEGNEVAYMILGATIAWGGQIISYYFRKLRVDKTAGGK